MKSRRWIVWLGIATVIFLAVAAFSFVNFRTMSSRLTHNSSMVSSTGSTESFQPLQPAKTGLVVTGENRLAPAFQEQITRQLQGNPQFGEIEILASLEDKVDYPILIIEITQKDIFWSPVVARSNLHVTVSYASDGDISFRLSNPVEFYHSGDQAVLKRSGQYDFSDASWGIISSPGYFDYLARETSKPIVKDLVGGNE